MNLYREGSYRDIERNGTRKPSGAGDVAGRAIVEMLLWILIRIDLLLAKPRRLSPPIARACNFIREHRSTIEICYL